MSKLITPSIEAELQPFTFYNVNDENGSLKVFYAKTQVEALKQLEEYQKAQTEPKEPILPTIKEEN